MKTLYCLALFLLIQYTVNVAADDGEAPAGAAEAQFNFDTVLNTRTYKMPLTEVGGSFKLREYKIEEMLPSLISLWKVGAIDFNVVMWPLKYCQAVYICFIEKKNYNDNLMFHVRNDMCSNEYMKFYPHSSEVVYKIGDGAETTGVYMDHIIDFKSSDSFMFNVKIGKTKPANGEKWNSERNEVNLEINLLEKDILIVTNSRMCHPIVVQSLKAPTFYPILEKNAFESDQKFPSVFYGGRNYIETIYVPDVGGGQKNVDLLLNLKEKTVHDHKEGKLEHSCTSYSVKGMGTVIDPVESSSSVSINSFDVSTASVTVDGSSAKSFSIDLNDCHWLRLWFAPEKTTMQEYKEKLDLTNTVDIFFNEGFFVPPDSDEARPLPGDSNFIGKIRFKVHALPSEKDRTLVEMAMLPFGKAFAYYEHFNLKMMHEGSFTIHLIRSPKCDASLIQDNFLDFSLENTAVQLFEFSHCTFTYFEGTKEE